MPNLKPAAGLAAPAIDKPYPNDCAEYRQARVRLLAAEIELRRALPLGGRARDYRFTDDNGQQVGLADLFGSHDTLVTYFWMFGPQRARPCPMCASFIGSLDVPARDYGAFAPDGSEWGALNVWVRRDGAVHHFWGEEIGGEMADPGQDPRGSIEIAPLWNVLDLTPGGRAKDWYPKLEY